MVNPQESTRNQLGTSWVPAGYQLGTSWVPCRWARSVDSKDWFLKIFGDDLGILTVTPFRT